tara:strand:+ start:4666 stop:5568 length:903 start_codon:yes stop_codon:yes gene_type:complete
MSKFKIFFDNVNFQSASGPNSFALKLAMEMTHQNCDIVNNNPDAQISIIQTNTKLAKTLLRLDGIYFNSEQDWKQLNAPIQRSYDQAEAVVYQSNFNKTLIEKYFGKHQNSHIIPNGTCITEINKIPALEHKQINDKFENIWACASHWRPHKRLDDNIKYFLEFSNVNDCLLVAGDVEAINQIEHDRIFYIGMLNWVQLISVFKAASHFIHLAFLDHCPNVVIDARACGCHVVCASSGGTQEIAGDNSTIIQDINWDLSPLKLYDPPKLDMSLIQKNKHITDIDIKNTCKQYIQILRNIN